MTQAYKDFRLFTGALLLAIVGAFFAGSMLQDYQTTAKWQAEEIARLRARVEMLEAALEDRP